MIPITKPSTSPPALATSGHPVSLTAGAVLAIQTPSFLPTLREMPAVTWSGQEVQVPFLQEPSRCCYSMSRWFHKAFILRASLSYKGLFFRYNCRPLNIIAVIWGRSVGLIKWREYSLFQDLGRAGREQFGFRLLEEIHRDSTAMVRYLCSSSARLTLPSSSLALWAWGQTSGRQCSLKQNNKHQNEAWQN